MMNTCIIQYSNPNQVGGQERVLQVFKHIAGSLVDFNLCQVHISYTRHVRLFLRSFIKEKVCHCLPGDMGVGGGLKFSIFAITSFLNSPLAADGIVFKTNAIADDSIVWTGSKLQFSWRLISNPHFSMFVKRLFNHLIIDIYIVNTF